MRFAHAHRVQRWRTNRNPWISGDLGSGNPIRESEEIPEAALAEAEEASRGFPGDRIRTGFRGVGRRRFSVGIRDFRIQLFLQVQPIQGSASGLYNILWDPFQHAHDVVTKLERFIAPNKETRGRRYFLVLKRI